jgi:peptidyl-prolyl cis-trans isomerase SurA
VVAVVGDQTLLWSDVITAINQRRATGMQIPPDSAGQAALAKTVLGELVDEEILVQKAKELKLEVVDADLASAADRQIKTVRAQFASDEEYRAELRRAGLGTPEEYRKGLIEQYRRQESPAKAFAELRKARGKPVNVTDEEVTAAFERSRSDLQKRPATITFRQIVVAPHASPAAKEKAKARADSLLAEIRRVEISSRSPSESMDRDQAAGRRPWLEPPRQRARARVRGDDVCAPPGCRQSGYRNRVRLPHHSGRSRSIRRSEGRHILIAPVIDSADVAAAGTKPTPLQRRGVAAFPTTRW